MRGDRRLVGLAILHVFLGLVAAALAPVTVRTPFGLPHIFLVLLFALGFSQVSLLGLWAVFAPSAPLWRALGAAMGTACLEAAFAIAHWPELALMPSAAMALTLASLFVVRAFGVRLSRRADGADPVRSEHERLRFTIRGLMLVTVAVALLGALARAVRRSPGHFDFILTVVWAACFVAVGLLALRVLTTPDGALRRGLSALAVSPVLGMFVAFAAEARRDGWVYIIATMLLYPAILLGSLLVVRACGFRLVRRPTPSTEDLPTVEPAQVARTPDP